MALKELRERQAKIVVEARERLDQITTADESRAKELETQHDTAMAEYDRLQTQIEREEKVEALEKRQNETRAKQRPIPADSETRGQDDGEKLDYRNVFHKFIAHGADMSELSGEERAVLKAGVQAKNEFRIQTAGTTTAGGFTVPVELANEIIRAMKMWGPMYDEDICTTLNTSSGNQINIPTVDDTAKSGALHTEGNAITDDGSEDVVFGQKRLDAYVYDTEFVKFSMELAQDSIFNVETLLGSLLGERLGRVANLQLTTADGSSKPQGVVTASTLGKTAAGAAAVTADVLIDLIHSVDPAYRQSPKVRFMFNDGTLAAVRKLKNGTGDYLWQSGDFTQGIASTLLGYRYSVNQAVPAMTTGLRSILFGDFGKFFVRKVGAPVIGVMRERFWPDLGIAGLIRFDGELGNTAAIKHLIQA